MESKILVSIICIVYNHEKFIEKAIKGFLMQKTNFSYEILIHEDASTDNSAKIIKKYEEEYSDLIKAIYQKENQYSQGKSPVVNLLNIAKGKYLAFCEGDDYWIDENKLQKQIEFLENNKEYYATYHNVLIVDENNEIRKEYQKFYPLYDNHTITLNEQLFQIMIGQTASIVARNFWKDLEIQNKNEYINCLANGDKKLTFIFTCLGKVMYFKDIMSCYRRIYTGSSWNAQTKNKNLSIFIYDSVLNLSNMIEKIFSQKLNHEICLKNILVGSFIYFLKKPTKKNLKIFFELYKKSKINIINFIYLFMKKIVVFILKKLKLIKIKNKRPIYKKTINLEGKKNL